MTHSTLRAAQLARFALVIGFVVAGAALTGARAEEATSAQRVACTPDAWRLCSAEIPNVAAVKACMLANKANLSAACRATFPRQVARR